LNSASARVRSGCERSLWIATGVQALAVEPRSRDVVAPIFVRVKTRHLAEVVLPDQVGEQLSFRSRSTG
jgi:hypothetical protein